MLCFQLIMVPGAAPVLCDIDHRAHQRGAASAEQRPEGRRTGSL